MLHPFRSTPVVLMICVTLTAFLFIACSDESTTPTEISETSRVLGDASVAQQAQPKMGTDPISKVAQDSGLHELLAALTYVDNELGAGLVHLFEDGKDQHTVFAPSDEAFEDFYALLSSVVGLPVTGITDIEPQIVLNVLQAHVVTGRRASNSVVPRNNIRSITPVLGEPFFVRPDASIQDALTGTGIRPDDPVITTPDISASNGIIHVIDQVIAPSVVDSLMNDEPSDELAAIISAFCIDVAVATEDAFQEFDNATRDLVDCFDDFEACTRGSFGRDCLDDFGGCIKNGNKDQELACQEFLRELGMALDDAMDSASAQGLEDEFLDWLHSPSSAECLQPALGMAALCAGLSKD